MSLPVPAAQQLLARIAQSAMLEHDLLPQLLPAAERELQALHTAAVPASTDMVRDLTARLWCSIDNDDSRDLDQLSVAEPLSQGNRVLVAIADVDALVARGSALDRQAQHNTTSVYTAARIFPMLPAKLSTDLTSLVQDEERLALVVDMLIDDQGALRDTTFYRARVVNRAKLAYRGVSDWLAGGPAPPALAAVPGLDAQLRLQDHIAGTLRQVRYARGALTLETIQTHPVFDGQVLLDLVPDRKNRAQELIEDLMIAANGATARYLEQRGSLSLRRVLRTPKRWDRIVELAAQCGESLPQTPDARALSAFLLRRRQLDPQRFPDLSLAVIKSLGSGEYLAEAPGDSVPGHFGLAVTDYTHSTAPNRRYPDLITQRLLKAALADRASPYQLAELQQLAAHCTLQQDEAAKVERRVAKSAAALLLEDRLGESFAALVTGASATGTWVRINEPAVEGRLTQGYEGVDVGEPVPVRLIHVDVERGFIDFARQR